MEKPIKCRYCKNIIKDEEDIFEGNISNNKDKIINGKFHKGLYCYDLYLRNKELKKQQKERSKVEYVYWSKLYQYIKKEILNYKDDMSLNNHMVSRLQGLRCGRYKPWRDDKVFYSSNGYTYDIILRTFIEKKSDILKAIANKTFDNENKKFDYIMAIIKNSINDVYLNEINKKNNEERFESINIKIEDSKPNYKSKNNLQKNKVANLLEDLF